MSYHKTLFYRLPFVGKNIEFIKNISTLITGGVIAQAATFLLTPIVARLYMPDDFGVAALFLSIASIPSIWSSFCYNQAILLPKEENETFGLIKLSTIILVILCLLFLIIILFFTTIISDLKLVEQLGKWIYIVPLFIFLTGTINILNAWNTRTKRYKNIAASQISNALAVPGTRIAGGIIFGSSVLVLILSIIFGKISQLLILVWHSNQIQRENIGNKEKKHLIEIVKKYSDFPIFNMPAGILNSFSLNLPVLILSYFFSPAIVGFYAMGCRLLQMPIQLIAASVRRVYMQKVAEIKNHDKPITGSLVKVISSLVLIGFLPFSVIFVFGEEIFSLFLGENWGTAGCYASILIPWFFSLFIVPPANAILIVMRKNKFRLYFQFIATFMRCFALLYGFKCGGTPEKALSYFSITCAFVNVVLIMSAYLFAKKIDNNVITVR